MKNSPLKNLAVTTVCLVLAMFAVCSIINTVQAAEPSEPHPANAMWTEPSTETIDNTTVNIGYRFNVTVWVNVTGSWAYTWQAKLLFNTTYFEATRMAYTGVGKSDFFTGHTTVPVTEIIDNIEGYALYGETLLGDDNETGYGSLMWVEFNLTRIPPQNHLTMNFSLADSFVLDPFLIDIPLTTVDGTDIPVIPEFPQMAMLLITAAVSAMSVILTKKLRS